METLSGLFILFAFYFYPFVQMLFLFFLPIAIYSRMGKMVEYLKSIEEKIGESDGRTIEKDT